MDFIIMDLEWNNTYARKTKGFINEIIEIGAVKLDENLNFKDKFSCLVRPQIGKKLRGSVKFDSQGPQGRKPPHGSTLENFVAGDTAAMARAVQQRGVFDRRSHVRLIRVDSIPMSPPSTTPETPP